MAKGFPRYWSYTAESMELAKHGSQRHKRYHGINGGLSVVADSSQVWLPIAAKVVVDGPECCRWWLDVWPRARSVAWRRMWPMAAKKL